MLTLQKKLRVPSFGRKASSTKRAAAFGEGGNSAGGIRASSSHHSQQPHGVRSREQIRATPHCETVAIVIVLLLKRIAIAIVSFKF